jgi:cobalt-zinc-cadmium efflux system membrane fusion protein
MAIAMSERQTRTVPETVQGSPFVPRALLLGVAWLWACCGLAAEGPIAITPDQQQALGIEVADVASVAEAPVAVLPAIVQLPGDTTRAVVVPFGGTVVRLLVQEGQMVEPGQPLLQLRSRDFLEVEAERESTSAQIRALAARVERERALVAEGISPARRLQESEAELRAAQARQSGIGALFSATRAVSGTAGEYLLLSPASGTVVESGLMPGHRADEDSVAFYIVDGDKVWLEAQLPERLIERISVGSRAEAGRPSRMGTVLGVGRSVEAGTRSAVLRAELPAGPGLRPGQAVELTVFEKVPAGMVVVPSSAVTRLSGREVVFLARDGEFLPVEVEAGLRTDAGLAVRGPGLAGGRVAVAGVSALKAIAQGE